MDTWYSRKHVALSNTTYNNFQNNLMENAYSKSLDAQILFWSQFNLPEKVKSIKESLETISKSQESSVKSRKELAAKTKELRSVAAGERLTFMKGLLKSYQEEIDHLTIRSQYNPYSFA